MLKMSHKFSYTFHSEFGKFDHRKKCFGFFHIVHLTNVFIENWTFFSIPYLFQNLDFKYDIIVITFFTSKFT